MQQYNSGYFQDGFEAAPARRAPVALSDPGMSYRAPMAQQSTTAAASGTPVAMPQGENTAQPPKPPQGVPPASGTPVAMPQGEDTGVAPAAPAQAQSLPRTAPVPAANETEAADLISNPNAERYAGRPDARADDLTALSQQHPEWMPAVYQKMGPDDSAKLIGDAMTGVRANHPSDPDIQAAEANALADGVNRMTPAQQAEIARAAANGDNKSTWAMGLVLSKPEASSEARGAFVDAAWDKAKATNGDWSTTAVASRAVGDVLAADQGLLDQKLENDLAGTGQIVANGVKVAPDAATRGLSNSPALRSDGIEKVVGMTADYQGPNATNAKAEIFRAAGEGLGKDSSDTTKPLVQQMSKLYASDPTGITKQLYADNVEGKRRSEVPGQDRDGNTLPRFFRDAIFNDQAGPELGAQVGQTLKQLKTTDPESGGKMAEAAREGYALAVNDAGENAGKVEKAVKGAMDVAFGLVPVPGGKLVEGSVKQIESATGEWMGKWAGERTSSEKKKLLGQAIDEMLQQAKPPTGSDALTKYNDGKDASKDLFPSGHPITIKP